MQAMRHILLILGLGASAAALAQYQWIDRDGRRVFSDTPPPPSVPQQNILPPSRMMPPAAPRPKPAAAPTISAAEPAPKPQQQASADAGRNKAEQERADAIRADNCRRALGAKTALDSGQRLARINERGEREFIDDSERVAEQQRLRDIIASECD